MDWQEKKIKRTIEYVKESGKSLQEVAVERFGSLENFLKLKKSVDEAKKSTKSSNSASNSTSNSASSSTSSTRQKDFTKQGFIKKSVNDEKVKTLQPSTVSTVVLVESHQTSLNEKEMNDLAAEALKAKLRGDLKTHDSLTTKLNEARSSSQRQTIVIPEISKQMSKPILSREQLADADIQTLYQIEKTSSARDSMDRDYAHNISKLGRSYQDDEDYADAESSRLAGTEFSGSTKKRKRQVNLEEREQNRLISNYRADERKMENCWFCMDSKRFDRRMVISCGTAAYLALPKYGALDPHHCLIIPVNHVSSMLEADDDVWEEVRNFKKCLIRMADECNQRMIFMELSMELGKKRHAFIEAIPVSRDISSDAEIYFHKAISECEGDWAQHKALIDTRKNKAGLRKSIPKQFPFFYVDFGLDEGFAHVIEDESQFPRDFGKNILGPLMGLDATQWRKKSSTTEEWSDMDSRLASFSARWSPFDWTTVLN